MPSSQILLETDPNPKSDFLASLYPASIEKLQMAEQKSATIPNSNIHFQRKIKNKFINRIRTKFPVRQKKYKIIKTKICLVWNIAESTVVSTEAVSVTRQGHRLEWTWCWQQCCKAKGFFKINSPFPGLSSSSPLLHSSAFL